MAVTRDDVVHMAALARLALDESRVPELVAQLNGILGHMDVLQQVKTEGVCGTTGIGDAPLPLRADGGLRLPLERPRETFAPAVRDGFFVVPRLATHQDVSDALEELS